MQGGSILFDQTYNVAFSDPTVPAAALQAENDLTGAGAILFNGPSLASSSASTGFATNSVLDSQQMTNAMFVNTFIGPTNILTGDLGTCQSFLIASNGAITLFGVSGGTNLTMPPGGMDIDTMVLTIVTNNFTTTITGTLLTSQTYEITGIPVPEPGVNSLLLPGGVALLWVGWRRRIGRRCNSFGQRAICLPASARAWASELILYWLWNHVGVWSLFALRYLVILFVTWLLWDYARRLKMAGEPITYLILLLFVCAIRAGTIIKPELFSLLLMCLIVWAFFHGRQAARRGESPLK